jgi:hypothetical protein
LIDSKILQERYCNINNDISLFKPEQLLEEIKSLIEKYLPVNKYENFLIKNDFLIEIKREDVPLRQMV